MCNPAAFYAISAIVAVAGGVMQHQATKRAQQYNNEVSKVNVAAAETQAVDALRLGDQEASERRMRMRQELASQTAGFGAQNVAFTGTALDILGDTSMFGQIDIDRIRGNAQRRAWGFRMDAYNMAAGNQLQRFESKVSQQGTILSTAGKVASSFSSYAGSGGGGGGVSSFSAGGGYGSTWGTGGGLAAAGYS